MGNEIGKRCGTCRYYEPPEYYAVYDCTWADIHPLPEVIDQGRVFPRPDDGKECQTWELRSGSEITEETCRAARQKIKDFWDGKLVRPTNQERYL
jgi:hypothetical protein